MKGKIALLSIFALLFSCKTTPKQSKESQTSLWIIGPDKVPCQGVAPQECLLIKKNKADLNYTYFYDTIKGFQYEPGYIYTLNVKTEKINWGGDIPADASLYKYKMIKLISKEKAAR